MNKNRIQWHIELAEMVNQLTAIGVTEKQAHQLSIRASEYPDTIEFLKHGFRALVTGVPFAFLANFPPPEWEEVEDIYHLR